MNDVVVKISDLAVSIAGRCVARVDSLEVRRGHCVAIVGESGSGKSSTLMATLGMARAAMGADVSGSIVVHGVQIVGASDKVLRDIRGVRLAAIPQNAQASFNPTLRIGQMMRRTLAIHGIKGDAGASAIEEAMDSVVLAQEILDRYPHEISGGQAQRAAIALALALGAELVLADEPTSALDVTVQAEIVSLLRRLRHERELTLLLVSHDLAVVSTLSDFVLVMQNGCVVESGKTSEVLTNPTSQYTKDLLAAVPTMSEG